MIPRLHMTPRFHTYINNLDHYFFDAMGNVTRLAIVGDEEGVIGQTFRGASLPLRTTHVPKLKELELGYYAIQDDLLDFLMAHSSTLEVRKLLFFPRVSICSVSIADPPSCCPFNQEHLAKSATASNIQPQLSQLQ